jgi:hypothetical protein
MCERFSSADWPEALAPYPNDVANGDANASIGKVINFEQTGIL